MVTINKSRVDVIDVADRKEAMGILKSISRNTDASVDEIVSGVSFSGLSVKDTVVTYSAFIKEQTGASVISFEQRGKKKVPVQLALDFERGERKCA